jgi:uncharacterized protein DUF3574
MPLETGHAHGMQTALPALPTSTARAGRLAPRAGALRRLGLPGLLAAGTFSALACATSGTGWIRTELFLGRNLPDGGTLSAAQVEAFLARDAGPRLSGWTLLDSRGHWIAPDGGAVDEPTSVLIVLHREGEENAALEQLRRAYAQEHGQQSVLRVDVPVAAGSW